MAKSEVRAQKRRRRLVISLRVLMLLIVLGAAALAWKVNRVHAQQRAVERITTAGGSVTYVYSYSLADSKWAPAWLRNLEGTTVTYHLPAPDGTKGNTTAREPAATVRTFEFPGTTPDKIPSVGGVKFNLAAAERWIPPSVEDFMSMTLDQIEATQIESETFNKAFGRKEGRATVHGAQITRDVSYRAPWKPAWLQTLIGIDYFREPDEVHFEGDVAKDEQLTALENLDHVRDIVLSPKWTITDADVAHLRGLTRLEKLDLSRTKLTDAGLAHLRGLSGLQSLNLDETAITGAGLSHLSRLRNLRSLSLHGTRLDDAGVASLGLLTRLEKLDISQDYPLETPARMRLTDAGMNAFKSLTNLRELSLYGLQISGASMSHLRKMAKLRKLWFWCGAVRDDDLAAIAGLRRLESLGIPGSEITGRGLIHLSGLTELRELDLSLSINLGDDGLVSLEQLPHLHKLNLRHTLVTDAGLIHVAKIGAIEELNLSENEITDAGPPRLHGLTKLKSLNLDFTHVGPMGFTAILDAIPSAKVSWQKPMRGLLGLLSGGNPTSARRDRENRQIAAKARRDPEVVRTHAPISKHSLNSSEH